MTFIEALDALRAHMKLAKYSPATLISYTDQLKGFGIWLGQQRLLDLRQVTRSHIDAYAREVRAQAVRPETQALRLRAVKRLFGHLADSGQLVFNPAEHIVEIRHAQRLPKPVPTVAEIQRLLNAPNTSTALGIRDRALFEVLYATGMRVGELEQVTVHHVDLKMQTLQVRHAKGGRARVVPLGKNAGKWLQEYVSQVRPKLGRRRPFERSLFLAIGGMPLLATAVRLLLRKYVKAANIKKALSPHTLRHCCATHMLQAGADIRTIQQLLGHVCLQSTVLYTRVMPLEVKETHRNTHPKESGHAPD